MLLECQVVRCAESESKELDLSLCKWLMETWRVTLIGARETCADRLFYFITFFSLNSSNASGGLGISIYYNITRLWSMRTFHMYKTNICKRYKIETFHWPLDCLFKSPIRLTTKSSSKLWITDHLRRESRVLPMDSHHKGLECLSLDVIVAVRWLILFQNHSNYTALLLVQRPPTQ